MKFRNLLLLVLVLFVMIGCRSEVIQSTPLVNGTKINTDTSVSIVINTSTYTHVPAATKTHKPSPTQSSNRFVKTLDLLTLSSGEYLLISALEDRALNGLYIVSLDGSILGRIAENNIGMAISPDLKYLAFTKYIGETPYLRVIEINSQEEVFFAKECFFPTWGPSSNEFLADCETGIELFKFDDQGKIENTIIYPKIAGNLLPKWSPNGDWFVFREDYGGRSGKPTKDANGLFLFDLGCFFDSSCEVLPTMILQISGSFNWSPDSNYLVLVNDLTNSLGIVDITTGEIVDEFESELAGALNAVWSNDGNVIAYNNVDFGNYSEKIMFYDIITKNRNCLEIEKITNLTNINLIDWISIP